MSVYGAGSSGSRRLRGSLVIIQVALSLTLLFGAALLGRSFARLVGVDPGFDTEDLTFLEVNLGDGQYPTGEEVYSFGLALRERLAGLPGVQEVSLSGGSPPSSGITFGDRLETADKIGEYEEGDWIIAFSTVDEAFLPTLGIELTAGRGFQGEDFLEGTRPVIIDRDLALHLWGSDDAVGGRFRLSEGAWNEVIGVTGDLKLMGLDDQYTKFAMLRPLTPEGAHGFLTFNIRSGTDPKTLFPALRGAVSELDPRLPVYQVTTAEDALWESVERPRFFLLLMGVFATSAVLLAGVGIYGLLSFTVSQRTKEMGIRAALGAEGGHVRALVLRGGLQLTGAGILLGLGLSYWASLFLENLLFQTGPRDIVALTSVSATMLLVSVMACYQPARRATRVNPVEILKAE